MLPARDKAYLARQKARAYAGKHPRLFYGLYGLRREIRAISVNRTTQLVIEGYPRSGNTFAVVAFLQAQSNSIRVAHHLHVPAQVMRAARWQIPTITLIREPADAVLSRVVRRPQISVRHALESYISFYETAAEYRNAYVVGTFQEVISEYGTLIERVNAKFGTRFSLFQHTKANVKRVFATIDYLNKVNGEGLETQVSRPSIEKERLKSEIKGALETKKARSLLAAAEAVYDELTPDAER